MDLNKVSLIGNLTQDPELKNIASGQVVTTFNVATNYNWRDVKTKEKKSRADFHKVVAWGHLAEIITTYLKKGSKIYLEGRLQNRTWEDKEGQKKYTTEIIASDNSDNIQDLFIFDKSGNVIIPLIKTVTESGQGFSFDAKYVENFPELLDWVILRDYNCDGFPDIITYSDFGNRLIAIW